MGSVPLHLLVVGEGGGWYQVWWIISVSRMMLLCHRAKKCDQPKTAWAMWAQNIYASMSRSSRFRTVGDDHLTFSPHSDFCDASSDAQFFVLFCDTAPQD